jgi:hypothetical protein
MMKRDNKQLRSPSKAGMPQDKLQPPSDVSPQATRGGDKESNEPLPRTLKAKGAQTSAGRKPGR